MEIHIAGLIEIIYIRFKQFFNVRFILIMFGLPFILGLILMNSVYLPDRFTLIPVGVVDQDKSDYSKLVVERLKQNKALKIVETTGQNAEKLVAGNILEVAFVIPTGFKQRIINEEASGLIKVYKNPGSIAAEMVGETVASCTVRLLCGAAASNIVVQEYSRMGYLTHRGSKEVWNEAWAYTDKQWSQPEPLMRVDVIDVNGNTQKIDQQKQDYRVLWGVLVALLMFFLLIGAWWMADERQNGTAVRLLCSEVPALSLIFGNIISLCIIGVIQTGATMLFFVFVPGGKSLPLFAAFLALLPYILFISSLALLVSVYLKPIQLNFFIPVFSLFTAVIGGCFWNSMITDRISGLSLLTPQGWVLKALDMISLHEGKLESVLYIIIGFIVISGLFVGLSYGKIKIVR